MPRAARQAAPRATPPRAGAHHPPRHGIMLRLRWRALPGTVRGAALMLVGCLLFSLMGAIVKLLGRRLDSGEVAFFRCLFGFAATLPFLWRARGRHAFRTTHPLGHFLRGVLSVASMIAGFYATTQLPLTTSTAISFTSPMFMIPVAIVLLGESVRWRRGLATFVGFLGVLVMVRPDRAIFDGAVLVGLLAALLAALSTTLIKRLSKTEPAAAILAYFGLFSSLLTAAPAWLVWRTPSGRELVLCAVMGILGGIGQYCAVRAYALGELTMIAPLDYSRLIFAGIMGYLLFAELPDRYTALGALIIVGSTLYIARREAHLSRLHRQALTARGAAPHPHGEDAAHL
jgi:drug/metabolite transporter (DMT)-like permease